MIQIPYQFQARKHQVEYLNNSARFRIAVLHRRAGKSAMALNDQIRKAVTKPNIYYYFLPTYSQAKRVIWDGLVKKHVPMELVRKMNESEGNLAIYWKNGSIQRFVGADNIDSHRGFEAIDVVFDEYAEMKEELWTAIVQPVLRANKGTATFIFTPRGMNHAWKLIQQAKGNSQWWTSIKTVDDTEVIGKEELEEARKTTTEAFFQQEYHCKFLEGAGQFFNGIDKVLWDGNLVPSNDRYYQIGGDLGKFNDWTVLTPCDRHTFKLGTPLRFNQLDWTYQKQKIEVYLKKFKNHLLLIDSTGLGGPIYDDLHRKENINVQPFNFTVASREPLLKNLAIMIENKQIQLPNDPILLDEMRSMQYEMLKNGKVKVQVPNGVHDDCIMSAALSVWELRHKMAFVKANSEEFKGELYSDKDGVENVRFNYEGNNETLDF